MKYRLKTDHGNTCDVWGERTDYDVPWVTARFGIDAPNQPAYCVDMPKHILELSWEPVPEEKPAETSPQDTLKEVIDRCLDFDFQECPECFKKPGTPILCSACLHNRWVIGKLKTELEVTAKQNPRKLKLRIASEGFTYFGYKVNPVIEAEVIE